MGILHHPVFGPVILTLALLVLLYPLILLDLDAGRLPVWARSAMLFEPVLSMEVHCLSNFVWSKIMHTKQ
ncbi:hypothetical protein EO98_15485 [Methanosarcina sp. 2.H.T.1A.6]|uniref:hypothetical protein n=1 Tax=unclassified Methanosarcina TaxID=2644672 RepID=UPI0006215D50|nr:MULTISPECIES: hypothetical protein [unclassified Methanosarcina]KKG15217.1 hypothetical protein EO94_06840 [Methanosarcina sp. 2.H.T.1A.3]KKG22902.1 hypothetical protein EO98_15485 [Methanosarcina sp. 2.H.T.1A.6]KKG24367.1 hypothetical protein EO96_14375 [Methanosarcina sp. 2.H.T.1A.8]KKG29146.1 hypothetical protein EO97_15620 [Methanosarcina sp. 2.H.T.1A.15]